MTPTGGSDWKILSTSWRSMTSRCLKDISPCSPPPTPTPPSSSSPTPPASKADNVMSFQMEEEEMENFMKLVDENGEISKHDLIIQVKLQLNPNQLNSQRLKKNQLDQTNHNPFYQTKQSSFWSGHLDLKNAPCGHSTKVNLNLKLCLLWNKDVYIHYSIIIVCLN